MNNVDKRRTPDRTDESHKEKAVYFDEAISLTGIGRYHYILFVGSGFCLVSLICVSLNTSYLLVPAQCEFNMTSQDKGILNSVLFLGMISSSHLWGFLADTQGRKKILVITVCCDMVVTIISSFAHTFEFFLICRFLNGFFLCGPSAVMFALLGEFYSDEARTQVVMWVGCFIGVGTTALPALAWLIIPQDWAIPMPWHTTFTSWRIFVVFCAIPGLITAIILIGFLKESPKFLLARGKKDEALKVLQYVYAKNTGKPPDTYPVHHLEMDANELTSEQINKGTEGKLGFLKVMQDQTIPLFKMPYLIKTILACIIQFGLYACCNGVLLWLPEIFFRKAEYAALYPNSSATICETLAVRANPTLTANGKAHLYTLIDDNQVQINISNVNIHPLIEGGDASNVEITDCIPNVDPSFFLNTLIAGCGCVVAYIIVGIVVKYVPKKAILVTCLTSSALSGLGMMFVSTSDGINALATLYVVLSGVCISILTSTVIDAFPTHLRAMAVCISLMFGRLGTVCGALLLGTLLDIDCSSVFFGLAGVVLFCGILSGFFPSTKQEKVIDVIT